MPNDRDPDIKLAGLSIWIDGYQFPDSTEYWDANWVVVRARCIGQRATVACLAVEAGTADQAVLPSMEPYLEMTIDRSGDLRGFVATVKLTPDNVTQLHEFRFQIDTSCLQNLIDSLRRILVRFPVRFAKSR